MREQFERAHASAAAAQQQAKRDNDLVYNEKVPPVSTLPKPTRKCMVKLVRPPELGEKYVSDPIPIPVAEPIPGGILAPPSGTALPSGISAQMDDLSIATVLEVGAAPGGGGGGAAAGLPMASVVDDASQLPPPPSFAVAQDAGLSQLVGIFPDIRREDAADALQRCDGSVQAAIELLLSQGHGQ